jgi:hypothetical protein
MKTPSKNNDNILHMEDFTLSKDMELFKIARMLKDSGIVKTKTTNGAKELIIKKLTKYEVDNLIEYFNRLGAKELA